MTGLYAQSELGETWAYGETDLAVALLVQYRGSGGHENWT